MAKRLKPPKSQEPALAPGDIIEYKLTYHVEIEPGIEAWVGYGNTTQVRETETGEQADRRLKEHVESEVERRIEEAIEG